MNTEEVAQATTQALNDSDDEFQVGQLVAESIIEEHSKYVSTSDYFIEYIKSKVKLVSINNAIVDVTYYIMSELVTKTKGKDKNYSYVKAIPIVYTFIDTRHKAIKPIYIHSIYKGKDMSYVPKDVVFEKPCMKSFIETNKKYTEECKAYMYTVRYSCKYMKDEDTLRMFAIGGTVTNESNQLVINEMLEKYHASDKVMKGIKKLKFTIANEFVLTLSDDYFDALADEDSI